jgi:hypothetical protein
MQSGGGELAMGTFTHCCVCVALLDAYYYLVELARVLLVHHTVIVYQDECCHYLILFFSLFQLFR